MSRPQKQTPKQGNTLFSYFSKTPKKDATPQKQTAVLSPRRSPNNKGSPRTKSKAGSSSSGSPATPSDVAEYSVGDVVWAKLEGYPYWPGIVCNDRKSKTHIKLEKGKKPQYHVHFFDTPPSWAWIRASLVKQFKGTKDPAFSERGGLFFTTNTKLLTHVKTASDAMNEEVSDRMKWLHNLLGASSDSSKGETTTEKRRKTEEEEEDEEDLVAAQFKDLDPDIFDAEMSEGDEQNDSKENKSGETPSAKSAEASPPKKRSRAARQSEGRPKRRRIMEPDSDVEDSGDDFKTQWVGR